METIRVPPTPALREWSRRHGYNPELVARWGAFYGDLPQLLAALERPPMPFLRLNPLRGDPDQTQARLEQKGFQFMDSGVPLTLGIAQAPFSPGATDEYLLGRYFLQDASSALAPLALEPQPGETIADLCAAPGGKTIQLAGLVDNRAAVFAFDADADRVGALESNLARCGVTCAAVYAKPARAAERLGFTFDRVLLDAPCTGEGVVQRDPGRRQGHLGEYAACAREQADLFALAHAVLRPGGVLVYSTCTLAPEENELQVERALQDFDFVLEPLPPTLRTMRLHGAPLRPGLDRVLDRALDARLALTAHALPHLHDCLGFYVARFRKGGAA